MGYSCSKKAMLSLDAVHEVVAAHEKCSNGLGQGRFWELGKEQSDGAVTGSVWRLLNAAERAKWAHLSDVAERVARAGGFRIEPDGYISRFPGLTKAQKNAAETRGAARFERDHPELFYYGGRE